MTAVGLFAGRGDVILSMGLALLFGLWAGWQLSSVWHRWKSRRGQQPRPPQD